MGMSLGQWPRLTLFGESHGVGVGVLIEGLPPGMEVDLDAMVAELERRRPGRRGLSQRTESDSPSILSGVHDGKTTGWPIVLFSENGDVRSSDYSFLPDHPRPGHADMVESIRTNGSADPRGGGSHSGRLTWGLVAAGSLVRPILEREGCCIIAHAAAIEELEAQIPLAGESPSMTEEMSRLNCLDPVAALNFVERIDQLRRDKDSAGSRVDVLVTGLPIGIGQPWFEGIEPSLANGLSAIPAVRAVEFGHGVHASKMRGSEHNTAWHSSENGPQHSVDGDGALGGISTGSPLRIRVHLKPPSSIPRAQDTLHLPSGEQRPLVVGGRHDPVLAPRAAPVVEAVTRFLLAEALLRQTRPF